MERILNDKEYLTPLRYPGGKQWLIRHVQAFLQTQRPKVFVEPFAGGGTVGLTLLGRGCFDHLVLVEKDPRVTALLNRARTDPSFPEEAGAFVCTRANVDAILADESDANLAMRTLVKNRCSFNGLLDGGLMRKVADRWNTTTLVGALRTIYYLAPRITLIEGDGTEALRDHNNPAYAAFVDPPYIEAGRKLYRHWQLDHEALFDHLQHWQGRFLATYDNHPKVWELVRSHGMNAKPVQMLTGHAKHKTELVIGPDLSWMPGETTVGNEIQNVNSTQMLLEEARWPATSTTEVSSRLGLVAWSQ